MTNHELAREATDRIVSETAMIICGEECDCIAKVIQDTYAPAMAELEQAAEILRDVRESHETCQRKIVEQEAALERLRRQVEHAKRRGVKYQGGFCLKQPCVRCYPCGEVEICKPNETRPQTFARMTHHPDCVHAKEAT